MIYRLNFHDLGLYQFDTPVDGRAVHGHPQLGAKDVDVPNTRLGITVERRHAAALRALLAIKVIAYCVLPLTQKKMGLH
jgi:hypothetical protein